ncbi:MAG: hypothetical protein ABFS28_08870 [Bacteroidota bacterium]
MNRREAVKRMTAGSLALTWWPAVNTMAHSRELNMSASFKYALHITYPQFDYFSVDSLGKSKLDQSPLLLDNLTNRSGFILKTSGGASHYYRDGEAVAAWEFKPTDKGFILLSNYTENNVPWVFTFDQRMNHATVLGRIPEKGKIETPALLHLPDMGSFRIRSVQVKQLDYTAERMDEPVKYVQLSLPPATQEVPTVEYSFEIAAIFPEVEGIKGDTRFDGFRRNYLNTFQVNPNWMVLSNNSSSDSCAFVQYGYSELALQAPNLVDDLRAIDLVGMTVDRYLDGHKGYGIFGYYADVPGTENVQWGGQNASLDTYPSLLIAACNYYKGTEDLDWMKRRYSGMVKWAEEILSRDKDGDGLIEYGFSGNSGSWSGEVYQRPANWWDTIGFGHKDAYANALAYSALTRFAPLCALMGDQRASERYRNFAERLKSNYYPTFFNPETGVLAGWKSEDGMLHDYYFTFVNGIAITFGLLTEAQGNRIMDAMLAKMDEVGFNRFDMGLPGNLLSIPRADYTHHEPRWGGHTSDELNDGWQHYENGGTSGNYVYFTLSALFRLGRRADAERILFPMLKAYEEGGFQGECENGMTRDWRTWDGECWGYEGFLVDNYWTFLVVVEEYQE